MKHPILLAGLLAVAVLATVCEAQVQRPARSRPAERPQRHPDRLKEGDSAPDFKLKSLDGKSEVQLSSFQGQKPVALVFGSYT